LNRLVINSHMNLQINETFTLQDNEQILVNQLAFLTVLASWKKGFGSWALVDQFNKQVDKQMVSAYKQFSAKPDQALIKLNTLVLSFRGKGRAQPTGAYVGLSKDNYKLETVKEMAYQKPNFENFWDRAKQNTFINSLGIDKWIELAQTGKASKISKPSLDNILDYDPSVDPKPNLSTSHINMPMILKTPMGDYHLLSGNAELKGIMDLHGNAKVWFIDGSQVEA